MFASGSANGGRHVFVMPSHRIYADTLARLSSWLQVSCCLCLLPCLSHLTSLTLLVVLGSRFSAALAAESHCCLLVGRLPW